MAWAALTGGTNNGDPAITQLAVTTGAVSVGDTICAGVTMDSGGTATGGSITDSLGNTWTRQKQVNDAGDRQLGEAWYCKVTNAGTPTVTLKFTPTPGTTTTGVVSFNVDPFSGSDASSAIDGTPAGQLQTAPTTTANLLTSGNLTTATANSLLYTVTMDTATGGNPGAVGTGFTALGSSGGIVNLKTAYKTQVAAGSTAGNWTAAVNDAHITLAFAVTPAGGGGGGRTFFVRSGLDGLGGSGPKNFNPSLS